VTAPVKLPFTSCLSKKIK